MSPPRPHLFARSAFAERANRAIAGMWARGWTEKPRLDPDFLWAEGAKGYSAEDEISALATTPAQPSRDRTV